MSWRPERAWRRCFPCGLSSAHLAALILPAALRRLNIARDNDRAGHRAADALGIRANADAIEDIVLTPYVDDFNTDLCGFGAEALAASLRVQLLPEDVERFLSVDQRPGPRPRQRAPVPGPSLPSAAPGLQNRDGAGRIEHVGESALQLGRFRQGTRIGLIAVGAMGIERQLFKKMRGRGSSRRCQTRAWSRICTRSCGRS
jgi:Toprim domain